MTENANTTANPATGNPIPIPARIAREIRGRPLPYAVLATFLLLGPIATHFLFPDAPTGVGIAGGLALGLYAALCAVPQKFL